jgi:hypothetical protein
VRESIPEDDGINLSAGAFDGGDASTSVLASLEGAYIRVSQDSVRDGQGGEIELLPLQVDSSGALADLLSSGVTVDEQ